MSQYVYKDGSNNFRVRGNVGNTLFYVYTPGGGGGGGSGVPGAVGNFTISTNGGSTCGPSSEINFNWTAPSDVGGSSITGYVIRQLVTQWIGTSGQATSVPVGYVSPWYANPSVSLPGSLINVCGGGGSGTNPQNVGNTLSLNTSNVSCGTYGYQIAAVNSQGTGTWYPSTTEGLSTLGVGVGRVGSDEMGTPSVGASNVTVSYTSSNNPDCPSHTNFQSVSGTLYTWDGNYGSIVSTYTGYSAGTASFTKPAGSGWYAIKLTESWTDYSTTCTKTYDGCLVEPFYVN